MLYRIPPPGGAGGSPLAQSHCLTVVVDAVDEADSHLSMVVGHEDDVEDVFTIGVQLPEPLIHSLQSLEGREEGTL